MTHTLRRLLPGLVVAIAAALLAGCAHPWNSIGMTPGATRAQVIARAGQPLRVVPLPGGGERLQYTLQPFGRHAFMVDLDASGHLVRARQVLTEADFHRIEEGKWTRADIDREFGPPAMIDRVGSWNGPVLTYRWSDGSDMFYHVYLDPQGVVQRAHPSMEFINGPVDRE